MLKVLGKERWVPAIAAPTVFHANGPGWAWTAPVVACPVRCTQGWLESAWPSLGRATRWGRKRPAGSGGPVKAEWTEWTGPVQCGSGSPGPRGPKCQPALAVLRTAGGAALELSVCALGVPASTAAAMLNAMQPRTASAEDRTMLFMMRMEGEIRGERQRNDSGRISNWKGFLLDEANKRRFKCQPSGRARRSALASPVVRTRRLIRDARPSSPPTSGIVPMASARQ